MNAAGEKTAVILSMVQFQQLLEDIEDLAAVAERREEPAISHEELVSGLKQGSTLSYGEPVYGGMKRRELLRRLPC